MKRTVTFLVLSLMSLLSYAEGERVNETCSPDSTKVAFTLDNDLYVEDVASGELTRLTFDGSDLILNGYASWVYYEEIFGRPSKYRAFWWSPDSRRIGFYRFDNSGISYFPIYSPFGQNGSLNNTRYPKAGQPNPSVRIGLIDLETPSDIVWASFNEEDDQYFGTPFWGADSREFYVSRMPRVQNTLDLYAVSAADGSRRQVYHETYPTWIDWMEDITFTEKGLYMVRAFETGWEQIYFLSYDGQTFRRLTDGENWSVSILRVDEKKGDIWFSALRDSKVHPALYRLDRKGQVTALTDPSYYMSRPDLGDRTFAAELSTASVPTMKVEGSLYHRWDDRKKGMKVVSRADAPAEGTYSKPELVRIENDGFDLYGLISYPKDFDPSRKYPVVVELYGGPTTPCVRDVWRSRDASNQWCYENGIIWMVVDPRSSGENGRRGTDEAYRRMTVVELQDYVAWAKWLQSKPFVRPEKICADGFSFGGTTTVMLLCQYPEYFHYGIAGGGVYDWTLYDTHYTERFMDTPEHNPEGYREATVLNWIDGYPTTYESDGVAPVMLKLTHGTGDDNVHFQNTLQLIDALQKGGKKFELMIYPDGMHGYRGYQRSHSVSADHDFWTRYLLSE